MKQTILVLGILGLLLLAGCNTKQEGLMVAQKTMNLMEWQDVNGTVIFWEDENRTYHCNPDFVVGCTDALLTYMIGYKGALNDIILTINQQQYVQLTNADNTTMILVEYRGE